VKASPFPEIARRLGDWNDLLPFLVAKTLHMSGYAFLTVVGMAGVTQPWRKWMFLVVVIHAPLSELAQYLGTEWFDTKRTGCVRDVIVDWVGVMIGCGGWAIVRRMRGR
jgi:hypothetical protein